MSDILNRSQLMSDPAADTILQIIHGATKFKIMSQCLEMGFFDELETLGEPCTAAVIAKRCGYDPVVTERLLDTLASFQLVQKEENNSEAVVYKNSTATSKYLTRSKRPTMIALTMMEQSVIIPMLDNLPMMLKSGKSKYDVNRNIDDLDNVGNNNMPNNPLNKPTQDVEKMKNLSNMSNLKPPMDIIPNTPKMMGMGKMPPTLNDNKSTLTKMQMMNKMTSLNSNSATNMPSMPPKGPMDPSEMQTKFIIATEAFAAACAPGLVKAFDLSPHREAVDLGGGSGRISFELSKTYPQMKVTLLDLPPVVQIAQKLKPPHVDSDKVSFEPGNFLEDDLPAGDLYILAHVVHGWDEQSLDMIFSKIYQKLPPGGSLLIMEKILNEKRDGPELAMANDLMLSLMTKGRERSSSEYQKLLSTHGFTHMKVKHIQGFNYYDVILAKKPF